jgi:lysophospholipase L1-like esterase
MKYAAVAALLGTFVYSAAMSQYAHIVPAKSKPSILRPLPMSAGGRVLREPADDGASSYHYRWPGTYFESAFKGGVIYFKAGPGDQILHIRIDKQPPISVVKPDGVYLVDGLAQGVHNIRIEVVTESQGTPGRFGGFALPPEEKALTPPKRSRQIEFIGDSYTVGYGNTSPKRDCSSDEVWSATDNSQAFGPLTAVHYNADYQINAISGRGIVRNYDGLIAEPVPVAYPFVEKEVAYQDKAWRPQIIVIGLGTNDFSTALKPEEKWQSGEELHAAYEATYVKFVQELRAKNPGVFFILMATDQFQGEIQAEVKQVMAQLGAAGEHKIAFIPMNGLSFTGCNWHPSIADDKSVSEALIHFIDAHPKLWRGRW